MDFKTSLDYAKAILGVKHLKEHQENALKAIYEGRDTIAVLPTGYGKSLIFQLLPWLLQKEQPNPLITIVATPLNAIMMDQVKYLCKKGITACYMDVEGGKLMTVTQNDDGSEGEDEDDTEEEITSSAEISDILDGKYNLIYAHPETLLSKKFGKVLRDHRFREKVCCVAVDEVHMICEWGDEFRQDFKKLGELTILYPDIPHLALTATASHADMTKLCHTLNYVNPVEIVANPDRPNIFLEKKQKLPNIRKYEKMENIFEEITEGFKENRETFPVTIVYCDDLDPISEGYLYVEKMLGDLQYIPAEKIPENRIFAQYHKYYPSRMKELIVTELSKPNPKIRLVFATVSLGMGLNAPSVSRVIHFRPPTTMEKYFQEIGRAGRAGQPASALMYYNNDDIAKNRKGLQDDVIKYVRNRDTCMRKELLSHFGFDSGLFRGDPSMCCSNCRSKEDNQ